MIDKNLMSAMTLKKIIIGVITVLVVAGVGVYGYLSKNHGDKNEKQVEQEKDSNINQDSKDVIKEISEVDDFTKKKIRSAFAEVLNYAALGYMDGKESSYSITDGKELSDLEHLKYNFIDVDYDGYEEMLIYYENKYQGGKVYNIYKYDMQTQTVVCSPVNEESKYEVNLDEFQIYSKDDINEINEQYYGGIVDAVKSENDGYDFGVYLLELGFEEFSDGVMPELSEQYGVDFSGESSVTPDGSQVFVGTLNGEHVVSFTPYDNGGGFLLIRNFDDCTVLGIKKGMTLEEAVEVLKKFCFDVSNGAANGMGKMSGYSITVTQVDGMVVGINIELTGNE